MLIVAFGMKATVACCQSKPSADSAQAVKFYSKPDSFTFVKKPVHVSFFKRAGNYLGKLFASNDSLTIARKDQFLDQFSFIFGDPDLPRSFFAVQNQNSDRQNSFYFNYNPVPGQYYKGIVIYIP